MTEVVPLFNSDKVKGDGYYGFSDGVHTVQTPAFFPKHTKNTGTLQKDPQIQTGLTLITLLLVMVVQH